MDFIKNSQFTKNTKCMVYSSLRRHGFSCVVTMDAFRWPSYAHKDFPCELVLYRLSQKKCEREI